MRGEFLIILAQIAWAFNSLFVKKLAQDFHPILITLISALAGTIFLLPFLFFFLKDLTSFPLQKFLLAILAGIFWIPVGEILFIFGLSQIPVSKGSLLSLTFPIFVTILGIIFLGEKITQKFVLAAILMVIGYLILVK